MTRVRKRASTARRSPVEPVSVLPSYCRGLDHFTDAVMRVPQETAIGPSDVLEAGGHVALVRPSGIALQVLDAAGDCRGVFASWDAARATVYAIVTNWETRA